MLSKYQEVKDLKVVPLLIDGTRSTTTGRTFPPFSNALQRELFLVESANPTSATAATKAVSKDFKTWKHTHTQQDIFLHSANILKHREDDLKEMMRAETSCTAFFAAFQIAFATSCT
jgi:acyl-CoA reductase-like NAD-dependent aldehyde dehydrogenase